MVWGKLGHVERVILSWDNFATRIVSISYSNLSKFSNWKNMYCLYSITFFDLILLRPLSSRFSNCFSSLTFKEPKPSPTRCLHVDIKYYVQYNFYKIINGIIVLNSSQRNTIFMTLPVWILHHLYLLAQLFWFLLVKLYP